LSATVPADLVLERLDAEDRWRLAGMTFPAYRHLLALGIQKRHPELGDERLVRPFGFVLRRDGTPVALALAELPADAGDSLPPQLLSVFVAPAERRRGLATALVERVEEEVRSLGYHDLGAVYTTGRPGIEWMEQLFAKGGWDAPVPQSLSVRFEPARALESPALAPERLRAYGEGLEIFPWSEIGAEELQAIRRSDEEQHWVEPALNPWQFDPRSLDPSSVGARLDGRVVGWVLNHRVITDVVRWSVAFMRRDLSRRARSVPLFEASLRRIVARGDCRFCTFITPFSYPHMIRLIRRWIAPISFFVEESRRIHRSL
jgi:GNAT superfamily N-acetyltransferase